MAVFYHWRGDPAKINHIKNDYHWETMYELPNCPGCFVICSDPWTDEEVDRYSRRFINKPNYFCPGSDPTRIGELINLCKLHGGSGVHN